PLPGRGRQHLRRLRRVREPGRRRRGEDLRPAARRDLGLSRPRQRLGPRRGATPPRRVARARMVTTRTCSNGHAVAEDYLRVCPKCGATLSRPAQGKKPPSLAPPTDEPVRVSRTVPFVTGGIVLALFGRLLTYAAERGAAQGVGDVPHALACAACLAGLS